MVAVPGLAGGVDEAARHLFADSDLRSRWTVHVLTTKGRRGWAAPIVLTVALFRLCALRARGRADLLHLNLSSRGSSLRKLIVGRVARLLRVPYVIQLHGGGFEVFHANLPGWGRRLLGDFFADAEHVFVLGAPFQELVTDVIGVPEERVSILRNAVALPPPREGPRGAASPRVLFTGRLGRNKGTFDLVEALSGIRHLDWTAVLAGDGEVDTVRARVAEAGLADRVTVLGWQPRPAIEELLGSASIFVLPSYLEALSVSLLEAMAAELCCIATAVGAQGEIVRHEDNGLLVAPGDVAGLSSALARAVIDGDLRARLGQRARATVAGSCSTGVVVSELTERYERTLASP